MFWWQVTGTAQPLFRLDIVPLFFRCLCEPFALFRQRFLWNCLDNISPPSETTIFMFTLLNMHYYYFNILLLCCRCCSYHYFALPFVKAFVVNSPLCECNIFAKKELVKSILFLLYSKYIDKPELGKINPIVRHYHFLPNSAILLI